MNTVKVGDKFEDKSYRLIEKAIENDELGISKSSARVFKKKGYYSARREKKIIFDLAIEIWPKNAKRYSFLFLIECKSSNSKKVPVDDVEEFWSKIDQVAGKNVKGIMISDNSFQEGGLTFAKNTGMMLIEVDSEDNHKILLHRTEKGKNENNKIEPIVDIFSRFIQKTLGFNEVQGLKILSANKIENIATIIRNNFNRPNCAINIDDFTEHLEKEYELSFDFSKRLETVNGKQIAGFYDVNKKKILIDNSIFKTEKFPFVLGHELGHFFLHCNLIINQERYNDFEDSRYDFFADKHILMNDKNWIEWQANKFAIALFLPKDLFLAHLIAYRKSIGISRANKIFLDEQKINQQDYYKTVDYLSTYFGISKTSVKYRIEDLELITYAKPKDNLENVMRRVCFE